MTSTETTTSYMTEHAGAAPKLLKGDCTTIIAAKKTGNGVQGSLPFVSDVKKCISANVVQTVTSP